MSTTRTVISISSAIILLLVLYNNLTSGEPESVPRSSENVAYKIQASSIENSSLNKPKRTLSREVKELKAELKRLKIQMKFSHTDLVRLIENQQSGEYQLSESNANEEPLLDRVEQEDEQVEQRMAKMEENLAEEAIDSAWSSATIDQVEAAFDSSELVDAQIIDLDCRKTLCRIEIDVDDPFLASEYQLSLSLKVGHLLPQTSMAISQDEEGRSSAILFMAREGYNLPSAEE